MSWVVGIDGCKGGWIAVGQRVQGGEVCFRVLSHLNELEAAFAGCQLAAIDMPIGLTEGDRRRADVEARKFISPRGSSVFNSPPRPLLGEQDYDSAKALCHELAEWKPTLQSWGLVPKMREVDAFVEPGEVRERVWEIHPEVSFRVLLGEGLTHSKHVPEGLQIRKALLEDPFAGAWEMGREIIPKRYADDHDLLDALAALWSAWRILRGEARFFPKPPFEFDACGRRMVIAG